MKKDNLDQQRHTCSQGRAHINVKKTRLPRHAAFDWALMGRVTGIERTRVKLERLLKFDGHFRWLVGSNEVKKIGKIGNFPIGAEPNPDTEIL